MVGSGALLRQCPLLLPQNREGTAYEGFVTAQVPGPARRMAGGRYSASASPPSPPPPKACARGQPRDRVCVRGGALPASPLAGAGRFPAERGAAGFAKQEMPGGVAGPLSLRCLPAPGSLPGAVERRPRRDPAGLHCLCGRNCSSFGGAVSLMACGLDLLRWQMFFWGQIQRACTFGLG